MNEFTLNIKTGIKISKHVNLLIANYVDELVVTHEQLQKYVQL